MESTMATNKLKNIEFPQPNWELLSDNELALNPYNQRDWNDYALEVETDKTGKPVFTAGNDVVTGLVNSLLHYDLEEKSISIKINNPLITTSKKVGAECEDIEASKYVIVAGNSRSVLIQEIHDLYHSEDYADVFKDWSVELLPVDHKIDSTLNVEDLFVEQIRDNTSVALSPVEQANVIYNLFSANMAKADKGQKTEVAESIAAKFGVSVQWVYKTQQFKEKFPAWFQELPETCKELNSFDVLFQVYQAWKRVKKDVFEELTLQDAWQEILSMAIDTGGDVTRKIVQQYRNMYLDSSLTKPTDQATETGETEAGETEAGETEAGEPQENAPKTLKTDDGMTLEELQEKDSEDLAEYVENMVTTLLDAYENLNPSDYEETELVKFTRVIDNALFAAQNLKTFSTKENERLIKEQEQAEKAEAKRLEKEKAKAAKEAEKQAAKEVEAAKTAENEVAEPATM